MLAFGYNALIAAVKLGLAPAAMYRANERAPFDTFGGDPNSAPYYAIVGAVVLVLYFAVFRLMYSVFKRRFRRRAGPPGEWETGREGADRRSVWPVVLAAVVVALVTGFAVSGGILLLLGLPILSYLIYVFATFGAVIALALVLAAVLAYKSFDKVEQRAAGLGDATLLASFFWLGLALLLLYHVSGRSSCSRW